VGITVTKARSLLARAVRDGGDVAQARRVLAEVKLESDIRKAEEDYRRAIEAAEATAARGERDAPLDDPARPEIPDRIVAWRSQPVVDES
jgi:hypothetical protein